MIKATAAAMPHLKRILGKYKAVFFGATGGGCNGYKYVLEPTNTLDESSNDEIITLDGVPIVICGKSMFLIMGTEIDWTEDHMGARFEFNNPVAAGQCGCGATFSANESTYH
jgi:iron-sulfur cluster assembly accessory protein